MGNATQDALRERAKQLRRGFNGLKFVDAESRDADLMDAAADLIVPSASPPPSGSGAREWSELQRQAALVIYRKCFSYEHYTSTWDDVIAEIAKHAHLFSKPLGGLTREQIVGVVRSTTRQWQQTYGTNQGFADTLADAILALLEGRRA